MRGGGREGGREGGKEKSRSVLFLTSHHTQPLSLPFSLPVLFRGSRVLELLQEESSTGSPLIRGAMEGLLGRVQVGRDGGREGDRKGRVCVSR